MRRANQDSGAREKKRTVNILARRLVLSYCVRDRPLQLDAVSLRGWSPKFRRSQLKVQAAPQAQKRRKLGGFGHRALKCTLLRSSAWELRSEVPGWNEAARELHQGWVVPLAGTKGDPGGSAQGGEASGSVQETAQAAPGPAGWSGLRARGCAAVARMVARDPAARKAAQVEVRSKFHAESRHGQVFGNWPLAEELATLGGCDRCLRSRAHWTVQATGRRLLTSLSCVCNILSPTSRFRRLSTGLSRRSSTLLRGA